MTGVQTCALPISGENLFDLFMAQSSQRFEPPQNTGRFIVLEQPFKGISGRTYRIDFVVDGEPIVVTGAHPNSVGSVLHKLVDIRGLIENVDAKFTVVIDDRNDPEGAKRESLIVQSVGKVFPFTALEATAPTSSAAH